MDADSQLIEAVSNGMLDVCMQLLNGREKICDRDGNNLVAIAAMNGHEPTLWYIRLMNTNRWIYILEVFSFSSD